MGFYYAVLMSGETPDNSSASRRKVNLNPSSTAPNYHRAWDSSIGTRGR